MKQIDVQIMGQSYLLGCPEEGESQMQEAVSRVDSAMCNIRDHSKVKARDRVAVLAALNIAYEQQIKVRLLEAENTKLENLVQNLTAAASSTQMQTQTPSEEPASSQEKKGELEQISQHLEQISQRLSYALTLDEKLI